MKCRKCNIILKGKYTIKFCSKSCAALYNNQFKPPQSLETRIKKSNTLKEFYKTRPGNQLGKPSKFKIEEKNIICSFCKKTFLGKRKKNKWRTWPTLCSNECYINTKRKNARGNKFIIYKKYNFDSEWEKQLAIFLDEKKILWEQPKEPIVWIDSCNKQRKYFPDFFIPKFNLFLDPKNPICCFQQKEKLEKVSKIINLIYGDVNMIKTHIVGLEGFEPSTL